MVGRSAGRGNESHTKQKKRQPRGGGGGGGGGKRTIQPTKEISKVPSGRTIGDETGLTKKRKRSKGNKTGVKGPVSKEA